MFPEIDEHFADGQFEKAFTAAKRRSIECLKQNKRADAAVALAQAGRILIAVNNPVKAGSFAQEAYDLARRENDKPAASFAEAVRALAHLRAGETRHAEEALDRAVDMLGQVQDERTALVRIVAAEIAMVQEDFVEARAYAEDAWTIGNKLDRPYVKAHARLIKATCEGRLEYTDSAMELLAQAEKELEGHPHAYLAWQIKAAMANICLKTGKTQAAQEYRRESIKIINDIASALRPDAMERFLRHPAVLSARGEELSSSGIWRAPVQVSAPKVETKPAARDSSLLRLRPVFDVIKKLNSEHNLRKLILMILDTAIQYCNAQRGTIVIFEGQNTKVELSRSVEKQDLEKSEMGISSTVLRKVRQTGQKFVTAHARNDAIFQGAASVHDQELLSILCLPLRVKTRLVGAVYLDNPKQEAAFGPREEELAEILTDHAAIAIDNALLHMRSIHDGLTSLFNQPHFEKCLHTEVQRARRHNRPLGLLMIDLDNFKHINDSLGHEAGNDVLRAISRLIASATRGADVVARISEKDRIPVVARYGGDEFEVLLPDTGRQGVRHVASRLLEVCRGAKFKAGTKEISARFSIGGASFPEDAADARTLILKADEALYAAKRAGKDRVILYSDTQQEAAQPN